jgi:tetrapyrrole methylase family protein/MazG family protein
MNELIIIGLGVFEGQLAPEAKASVEGATFVVFQTARSPHFDESREWTSCDDLYDACSDFDELNRAVAKRLADLCGKGRTAFCMPGTPLGKAMTCEIAKECKARGIPYSIIPGTSYADAVLAAAGLCFDVPAVSMDAIAAEGANIDPQKPLVVCEIDSPLLAGSVKLALLEYYPAEWEITFAVAGKDAFTCTRIPLFELDRQKKECFSAGTCAILPPLRFLDMERRGVAQVEELVRLLRGPGGCPWDAEQTTQSLRPTVLEEAYEVAEAIDKDDDASLCEELGDLLLQVVFLCVMAEEQGRFTLRDAATDLCAKMIFRHPHVFGDAVAKDSAAVLSAWENLKKTEKGMETQGDVLKAVPKTLPALTRSAKVQKKAAKVGFDWDCPQEALKKVVEEVGEFAAELESGNKGRAFEEMGDLLFAVVNAARLSGIDPELALNRATEKFTRRFCLMEEEVNKSGRNMEELSLRELDAVWDRIKAKTPQN